MFELKGRVIKGEGVGRTIGYPTANLDRRYSNRHPVPDGVWACAVKVESRKSKVHKVVGKRKWYKGVAVIGMRDKRRGGKKVEIYLLDFKKNIYGRHLEVVLVKRLRKLKKFNTVPELVRQVKNDIACARRIMVR